MGKNDEKKPRLTSMMTFQQISAESGVPYTSVRKMALDGCFPVVRLGDSKRSRVRRVDWERFVEASTETVSR